MNRREFLAAAAAAPVAFRASLAEAATRPRALVTCDMEERLAIVDLGTFRVVGSIPTLPDPRSIELVGRYAVVCHTAVGGVSIVEDGRVRHVLHDVVEPRYTAGHPDGRHAFVTDSGRSGVVLIDLAEGKALARAALPGWARHLTIDPSGRRLWIGLGTASQHVAVVDTAPLRHVGNLTPGFLAHDVGHASDGRLWITSGAERELAVAGVRQTADLAPQHVTFGNGRAYVTSGDSGLLRVHDLAGRLLHTTPIPTGSYNVQQGFGRVLTPSLEHGTLTVVDSRGALLARVQVASSCHDACFSAWRET